MAWVCHLCSVGACYDNCGWWMFVVHGGDKGSCCGRWWWLRNSVEALWTLQSPTANRLLVMVHTYVLDIFHP